MHLVIRSLIAAQLLYLALPVITANENVQTVNILVFYKNPTRLPHFDSAIDFIKATPSLKVNIGHVYRLPVDGAGITEMIELLCQSMDNITSTEDARPDIVVDLTKGVNPSESVKILVKSMNLPTISASFGREKVIRAWRELTDKAKHYLIQIAPPNDLLLYAVKSIVSKQDLSNAFISSDQPYHQTYQTKTFLETLSSKADFKSRHSLIPSSYIDILLSVYSKKNFSNVFLLWEANEISEFLSMASRNGTEFYGPFTTGQFSWYSISSNHQLPNCSNCMTDVSLIHLSPKLPEQSNKRRDYLQAMGHLKNMSVNDMFYFDLTTSAVLAVGKMKREGTWKAPPNKLCKDTDIFQDDYELDLFHNLNDDEVQGENILGKFHMDPEMIMGRSYAQFEMNINRLFFKSGQKEPESNILLGTWKAGFGGKALISSEGHEEEWEAHKAVK